MKNTSGCINSIRKKKRVKVDPKNSTKTKRKLKKDRYCLKCGKKFLSKGPYNRICDKCGVTNERVATCIYSVSGITSEKQDVVENRFFALN